MSKVPQYSTQLKGVKTRLRELGPAARGITQPSLHFSAEYCMSEQEQTLLVGSLVGDEFHLQKDKKESSLAARKNGKSQKLSLPRD